LRAIAVALEKATHDSSWMVNKPAEAALEAIKLRDHLKAPAK